MKKVLTIHNGIKTTTKVRYFIAGFFQVPGMVLNEIFELMFGNVETKEIEIKKAETSLAGYLLATIFVAAAIFNSNNANKVGTVVFMLIGAGIIIGIKKLYNNAKLKKHFNV